MRQISARDIEPHRAGAGGEKKRAIGQALATCQLDVPAPDVDRGHPRAEAPQ